MHTPLTLAPATAGHVPAPAPVAHIDIPQYGRAAIAGVWAAAALPMAALAWLAAPALAHRLGGTHDVAMAKSLLVCLTAGLVWQFALVLVLVGREQGSLRWAVVRRALWLQAPQDPRTRRRGGRVWLVLVPLVVAAGVVALVPALPAPAGRDLGTFLGSDAGRTFFHGAWGWYALTVAGGVFNTVLGEELLFRGFLLPRMRGAFGRGDWVANGVLFAAYHLHEPWVIPVTVLDMFTLAYPARRLRSAWIGIAVHSAQTVFFSVVLLALVL